MFIYEKRNHSQIVNKLVKFFCILAKNDELFKDYIHKDEFHILLDVRLNLQIVNEQMQIKVFWGNDQYHCDHKGYWSYNVIFPSFIHPFDLFSTNNS
jgi:hypothetical protein